MTSPVSPPRSARRYAVIAIDGPAASGKSSTAQWVANELGYRHVDSGALYRAATLAAMRHGGSPDHWTEGGVVEAASGVRLAPERTSFVPILDDVDVGDEIRGSAVTAQVPAVARMPAVRAWVNAMVRQVAEGFDVVVDGRDMGTAVFPDAQLKVFLVANPRERARRRLVQRLGRRPSDEEVAEEADLLEQRDTADAAQTVPAPDAVVIDTSALTQADQVERIVELARALRRSEG